MRVLYEDDLSPGQWGVGKPCYRGCGCSSWCDDNTCDLMNPCNGQVETHEDDSTVTDDE